MPALTSFSSTAFYIYFCNFVEKHGSIYKLKPLSEKFFLCPSSSFSCSGNEKFLKILSIKPLITCEPIWAPIAASASNPPFCLFLTICRSSFYCSSLFPFTTSYVQITVSNYCTTRNPFLLLFLSTNKIWIPKL